MMSMGLKSGIPNPNGIPIFSLMSFGISIRSRTVQSALLVFMGDDTHFGEKVRDPEQQDKIKAARELGYQPPWDDLNISKALVKSGIDREKVIHEYAQRILE